MLGNARVVLVRPHYAGNLGAVARVMCNFGVRQLTLVAPFADLRAEEARRLATHGEPVLESATVVPTLDEAVADCRLVVATSANVEGVYRTHNYGRPDEILPEVVAALDDGPCALVFGPEPSGLSNAEVARCHGLIRILTDPACPSLNLSHAVAICLYELRRLWLTARVLPSGRRRRSPPTPIRNGCSRGCAALEAVHFVWGTKADSLMHAVRHLIARAKPSPNEVRILFGLAGSSGGSPSTVFPPLPRTRRMNPMDEPTLSAILWGVAVLFLGWTWVPALVSGLGGTRYTNGGSDDPTALDPTPGDPDYAFWHRQLIGLGYEPVGPAWMRISFHGPEWRFETRAVRVFHAARQADVRFHPTAAAADGRLVADFVRHLLAGRRAPADEQCRGRAPGEGDYVVQGIESIDLAAVEELHLGQKARLEAGGRKPDRDGSLGTLLKAAEQHAGRTARHLGARLGQTYLATHAAIHLFLSFPVAYMLGVGHWAVPMVNLVLGGILRMSEYAAKRQAGTVMRTRLAVARPSGGHS